MIEENDTVFFLAAQKQHPHDDEGTYARWITRYGVSSWPAAVTSAATWRGNWNVTTTSKSSNVTQNAPKQSQNTWRKRIVLVGDCADEELLREEAIDTTDVYCVLTNDDEANILSSMLAKQMGAEKVIAIINRPAYVDLVESGSIDIAVSPQQITIGALLTHIRRGNMVRIHSLRRGCSRSHRSRGAGRQAQFQGGRQGHRGYRPAAGHHHPGRRSRRGCHHRAPRHRHP